MKSLKRWISRTNDGTENGKKAIERDFVANETENEWKI